MTHSSGTTPRWRWSHARNRQPSPNPACLGTGPTSPATVYPRGADNVRRRQQPAGPRAWEGDLPAEGHLARRTIPAPAPGPTASGHPAAEVPSRDHINGVRLGLLEDGLVGHTSQPADTQDMPQAAQMEDVEAAHLAGLRNPGFAAIDQVDQKNQTHLLV